MRPSRFGEDRPAVLHGPDRRGGVPEQYLDGFHHVRGQPYSNEFLTFCLRGRHYRTGACGVRGSGVRADVAYDGQWYGSALSAASGTSWWLWLSASSGE